jgi:hypothetical protein
MTGPRSMPGKHLAPPPNESQTDRLRIIIRLSVLFVRLVIQATGFAAAVLVTFLGRRIASRQARPRPNLPSLGPRGLRSLGAWLCLSDHRGNRATERKQVGHP